jgi:uncharacterized protein involved in exopolysaccharide biosynthesis
MASQVPAITVSDILRSSWRRKFVFAATFVFVFVLVLIASTFLTRMYHSEAKLLVRLGSENATLDHTATMGPETVVAVPQSRDEEMNSVVDLLHSRGLAEKVVEKLGAEYVLGTRATTKDESALDKSATSDADAQSDRAGTGIVDKTKQVVQKAWSAGGSAIESCKSTLHKFQGRPNVDERTTAATELLARYTVTPVHHSDVIQIDCKAPNPDWAQTVTSKIIETYVDEHIRMNQPLGSLAFFVEQADRARLDLQKKQEALRDLKVATGMISPNEQRQSLVTRMSRVQEELMQSEAALKVSESRLSTLRQQLAGLPAEQVDSSVSGIGNTATDAMRAQLYQLEVKQKEAAAKFTPDHPILQALNEQVLASRAVVERAEATRTQITHGKNRLYQDTQMAILQEEPAMSATAARRTALLSQLAEVKHEMDQFDASELKVARLEQEVAAAQQISQKYDLNKERERIDQERSTQRLSNICLAQAATREPDPIFPRTSQVLGAAAALALLSSMAVAWRADRKDRRFHVPDDIQHRLGMPLAGAIPRIRGRSKISVGSNGGN